jgi:peptidase S24-like protein
MKKSANPQIDLKNYKGDGLLFYNAVSTSGMAKETVRNLMGVSDGTFYGLYKKETIDDKYKIALSKVIDKPLEEIFEPIDAGVKPSTPKQVITIGKHTPLRLTPEEYAAAFGDWKGLPMYNTPVTASFIQTYRDEKTFTPQYYLHDPRFRDCDFGAIITGDSMYAEIRHGDFIACKEIEDTRFIVFGDIYYIVATNGLETCKYINADPKSEENYLLVPRNESISPSPIPKDMILKMYKVRGIIRGY